MSTPAGAIGTVRAPARIAARLRTPAAGIPVAAGVAATLVTALGSWIPSLWGDEAASALSAQRSLPSFLLEVTHVDAVHAVYYAGLHLWVAVFGASAFALRFPSALATGATVAGVIVLVRLFDRGWRLALVAACLATLLPRLDYAGVEARGYAWTAAFASWVMIAAAATLRDRLDPRVGWPLYAVGLGLGTALDVYLGSLIAVTGCLAAAWPAGRRHWRSWAAASAAAILLAAPVIGLSALERHQVAFLAHLRMPASTWLVGQWFGDGLFALIGWTLMLLAVGVMLARRDRGPSAAREGELDRGLGLALVLWAGLPSAFLIGTITTLHNYTPRYLTFAAPAAAVLMALGVDAILRSWRPAGFVLLAGVVAAAVPPYLHQRTPYAENGSDWARLGHVIAQQARPGDELAVDQLEQPSRRPINAYRLYPRDFADVTVPQLTAPYYTRRTWDDGAMTIEAAAARHRFAAGTVFAVEADYRGQGLVDVDGVPSLEADGYHVVEHWRLHSDLVYELDRAGVTRS